MPEMRHRKKKKMKVYQKTKIGKSEFKYNNNGKQNFSEIM